MLAYVITCAIVELNGDIIEVEVDIPPGLPSFSYDGITVSQETYFTVR